MRQIPNKRRVKEVTKFCFKAKSIGKLVITTIFVVFLVNASIVNAGRGPPRPPDPPDIHLDLPYEFSDPLPNPQFKYGLGYSELTPPPPESLGGKGWTMVGDGDRSGYVEIDDFIIWANNYHKSEGEWDPSVDPDYDGNGYVDEADYHLWQEYGGCGIYYDINEAPNAPGGPIPFGESWYVLQTNRGEFCLKNLLTSDAINALRSASTWYDCSVFLNIRFSFWILPNYGGTGYVTAEIETFWEGGSHLIETGEPTYLSAHQREWTRVEVTMRDRFTELERVRVNIHGYGTGFEAWIDKAQVTIFDGMAAYIPGQTGKHTGTVEVLTFSRDYGNDPLDTSLRLGVAIATDTKPWEYGELNFWVIYETKITVELLPIIQGETTQPGELEITWSEQSNDAGVEIDKVALETANRMASSAAGLALSLIGTAASYGIGVVATIYFPPAGLAYWAVKFGFTSVWWGAKTLLGNPTNPDHRNAYGGNDPAVWETWEIISPHFVQAKSTDGYLELVWRFDSDSLYTSFTIRITSEVTWTDVWDSTNYKTSENTFEVQVRND